MKAKKHLALLLACALLLTTCIMPASKASAAKIKLNKKTLNLRVNQSYTLKLKNCKKKIKWSSSKKSVASVSSKGKVKAKKAGKATITAKVGKKKYKCKVTVKKANTSKASPTPKTVKTPQPTATAPATGNTPSPSPTLAPTATPDLSPEALKKNVDIKRQFFPEHILLTVTNNNTVWLDSVTINYEYYGLEESTHIASGFEELFYLKPGVSQYITIPTVTIESEDTLDQEASGESIEVTGPDLTGNYTDQSDKLEIADAEMDEGSLSFSLINHSPLDVKVNYLVQFYDASNTLLDVTSNTDVIELEGKDFLDEDVEVPSGCTKYEILTYAANFEEIDDTVMLTKGISTTVKQILADCLVVEVTNGNDQWLKSVDVSYDFYDADDEYLFTGDSSLLSMAPGESQPLVIPVEDPDMIGEIDLNYSVADISPEKADDGTEYQRTSSVTTSIDTEEDEGDEWDEEYEEETYVDKEYTIIFNNTSVLPTDGSYIIYFRNSKGEIISAIQDTLSIDANSSDFITVYMPLLYDQDDEEIALSALQESDIHVVAHTYTENS